MNAKKTMARLTALLCMTACLSSLQVTAAETVVYEGITYTLYDNSAYVKSGDADDMDIDITIPSYVDGLPVTRIDDSAFYFGGSKLRTVVVAEGIEDIGTNAFATAGQLQEVSLPASLQSIGKWAFGNCNMLETIHFAGTEEQWNALTIEDESPTFLGAEVIFESVYESPYQVFTFERADVNGDGLTDATDAAYILQYAAYAGAGGTLSLSEFYMTLIAVPE